MMLCAPVQACAQSAAVSAPPAPDAHAPTKHTGIPASELERLFFGIVKDGDTLKFLSYVPDDGVNLGRDALRSTRTEIEDQLTHRTGLYCRLFDSSCIPSPPASNVPAQSCSYRELLTQSEKVRTASTETKRNGVRQAILAAEIHNQKCSGAVLIDFIFNYQEGGWKLFSIP